MREVQRLPGRGVPDKSVEGHVIDPWVYMIPFQEENAFCWTMIKHTALCKLIGEKPHVKY